MGNHPHSPLTPWRISIVSYDALPYNMSPPERGRRGLKLYKCHYLSFKSYNSATNLVRGWRVPGDVGRFGSWLVCFAGVQDQVRIFEERN